MGEIKKFIGAYPIHALAFGLVAAFELSKITERIPGLGGLGSNHTGIQPAQYTPDPAFEPTPPPTSSNLPTPSQPIPLPASTYSAPKPKPKPKPKPASTYFAPPKPASPYFAPPKPASRARPIPPSSRPSMGPRPPRPPSLT